MSALPKAQQSDPLVWLVPAQEVPHTFRVYRDVPVMILVSPHTGLQLFDVVFPEKRCWVPSFQAGIDMIDAYHLDKDTRVFCRKCGGERKDHRCVECGLFSFDMEALTPEQRSAKFPERYPQQVAKSHAQQIRELEDEAEALEHGIEYNVGETLSWTDAERAANNRAINQSRALRDRADALRRAAGRPDMGFPRPHSVVEADKRRAAKGAA